MITSAIGTKVYSKKDGTVTIVPPDADYAPDKEDISLEVKNINIDFSFDEGIKTTLEIFPKLENPINVTPIYYLENPDNGEKKKIEAVKFDDGSIWRPL